MIRVTLFVGTINKAPKRDGHHTAPVPIASAVHDNNVTSQENRIFRLDSALTLARSFRIDRQAEERPRRQNRGFLQSLGGYRAEKKPKTSDKLSAYNRAMHWAQIWKFLTLIVVANGTPVIVRRIWGGKCAQAIDFGYTLRDARSIFGPSKTIRGLLCSIAASVSTAPVLGLDWLVGLLAGASAMAGDLFSSFVKRRMGFRPSERATGLDQIPESLIPATACANALGLNWLDVLVITGAFFAVSILLSRILYGLSIRRRPY